MAGAGDRARTVTARLPRHRSLAAPARFAARWRELAACRGTDLGVFFPGRGESAGPARRVCAACPVWQPCLDYAITNRIMHGIWGGLTGQERRALQSRWVRASRRNRDGAISAAVAAGYTVEAVGRSFGLSRTTVARIVRTGTGTEPGPGSPHPGPDFVSGEPEARL
jgi:WhiB family redox-sensing transcriptional regulator